jgi:RNA polymerase sigma-70 factor (ECF subfamily)
MGEPGPPEEAGNDGETLSGREAASGDKEKAAPTGGAAPADRANGSVPAAPPEKRSLQTDALSQQGAAEDENKAVDAEDRIAAAIADGDHRKALRLCAQEHAPAVGRLCMALVGSQAEADDLVQETLITAHDSFDSWRGEGSLRAWLFGIARRKCLRHLEKHRRRQSRLRLLEGGAQADTEELVLLRQRADVARGALDAIRPTEREALLLRYVGQLSFEEVALACGIDEAAARKRVSRAIVRLRETLKEVE